MRQKRQLSVSTDVVAGVCGALVFFISLALHIPLWLAALFGAGIYIGIRFMFPTDIRQPVEVTVEIPVLLQQVHDLPLEGKAATLLGKVYGTAERLQFFFSENEEDRRMYEPTFAASLQAIVLIVQPYQRVVRYGGEKSEDLLEQIMQFLEQTHQSFQELHEMLLRRDREALSGLIASMTKQQETIREINQVQGGSNS